MAKPAQRSFTHTARTWTVTFTNSGRWQFAAAREDLVARVIAEAEASRTQVVDIRPALPFPGDTEFHTATVLELTAKHAMTIAACQTARAA